MRRSPFYEYPAYPLRSPRYSHDTHSSHPLLVPQQQQYRRPSTPTSNSPSHPPRSVINVPVFDSTSTAPHTKVSVAPSLDPVAAAIRIQSCFRGYAIRRHHLLIHLRTISASRKRLESLKLELESPGFSNKVKSSEKERLRFSESVMAIILQLDSIEGFVPEIRKRRKEVTKMAIKLQDAMDAILSLQEEEADDKSAHSALGVNTEDIFCLDSANALAGEIPFVQGEEPNRRDIMNKIQEATVPIQSDEMKVDEELEGDKVQYGPPEVTDLQDKLVKAVAAGGDLQMSHVACAKSIDHGETNPCSSQDPLCNSIESFGVQAAIINSTCSSEVGKAIASGKQSDQTVQEERSAKAGKNGEITAKPSIRNDRVIEGLRQHSSPVTPACAEDLIDAETLNSNDTSFVGEELLNTQVPNASDQIQGATPAGFHIVSQAGRQDVDALSRDDLKKLFEESGQLKFMLGKLLAQSKAQSKVICALGDRLEMLEQQQQLGCQNNLQRGKKKVKKGCKRSAR